MKVKLLQTIEMSLTQFSGQLPTDGVVAKENVTEMTRVENKRIRAMSLRRRTSIGRNDQPNLQALRSPSRKILKASSAKSITLKHHLKRISRC